MTTAGFVVLVPVKAPGTGKSRLSALSSDERARLAAAFAGDVVEACLRTPGVRSVLVVSDDAGFAAELAALGAATTTDPGGGLNAALRHGAAVAQAADASLQPVALLADLPTLRPDDLAEALDQARDAGPCFVRDADGTGSSLYTAPCADFTPAFGRDSAAAHLAGGARELTGALTTLRRDVDDADGLSAAVELGVGVRTAAALALGVGRA